MISRDHDPAAATTDAERPPQRAGLLGRGYQGAVFLENDGQHRVIVKKPVGPMLVRALRRAMIRREYAVYRRLEGIPGIPQCGGLRDGENLVLEFVEGRSLREAGDAIPEPQTFFSGLLDTIQAMHRAGVAHTDLKRKDNVIVDPNGRPVLIDFGTAVVSRADGGRLNRFLFRQACRTDLNAWVKLKYNRRYENISAADRPYFQPTVTEKIARLLRPAWRLLTLRSLRKARRRRRGER